MYKVVRTFIDTDKHKYLVGDEYPHKDAKKPLNARIKTLSSTNNKYGQIYIEKIEAVEE